MNYIATSSLYSRCVIRMYLNIYLKMKMSIEMSWQVYLLYHKCLSWKACHSCMDYCYDSLELENILHAFPFVFHGKRKSCVSMAILNLSVQGFRYQPILVVLAVCYAAWCSKLGIVIILFSFIISLTNTQVCVNG